jgi:peptide/nickel transport system permease protein
MTAQTELHVRPQPPRAPQARRKGARRLPIGARISGGFLVLVIVISAAAPLVAPDSPNAEDLNSLRAGPSWHHLLGTDSFGRDILSRLIWGGRPALLGVALAMVIAVVVGTTWGAIAGYGPRFLSGPLMRLVDAVLSFPAVVLAVAITGVLGPGLVTSMVSVGVVFSPFIARLTRSGVMAAMQTDYVAAAKMSGCPWWIVLARHAIPAAAGPVVVQSTVFAGLAFIVEAALSFLGLGVQPPNPSWGGMLADAYQYILVSPGQMVAPGVIIALVVLAVYRLGDELRSRIAGSGVPTESTAIVA